MKLASFNNELVYGLPDMEKVVLRSVGYRTLEDSTLTMDIYYPTSPETNARFPVVIFVMGYSDTSPVIGGPLKDTLQFPSWGRLLAASGFVAVMYQTRQSDDLKYVVGYIRKNAKDLNVDENKVGLWSCSGNTLAAISFAMQERRDYLLFAIFYYGFMLTPGNEFRKEINELCDSRGCYATELEDVKQLRTELPLLIVRAGMDTIPFVNESIDHFVKVAISDNTPITFINYPEGIHGFDIKSWWKTTPHHRSVEIIKITLEFMRSNFANEGRKPL
jgi:hypothetical protein